MFYGLFAGSYVGLINPLLASLSRSSSEIGLRMGIAFFFSGIGGLIGTPIGGALLTEKFIWWQAALFSGTMALIGSVCFAAMLILLHRKKISGELA
ncbi:hypothetical protein C8R42DRAFT_660713 [Lentinula raphanica]|nr:hypothetical protein C8R42DRAFT_660713 [Lentinula raphanica]